MSQDLISQNLSPQELSTADRNQTIATLYVLRGGLSVMASYQEKAFALHDQIQKRDWKIRRLSFDSKAEEQDWLNSQSDEDRLSYIQWCNEEPLHNKIEIKNTFDASQDEYTKSIHDAEGAFASAEANEHAKAGELLAKKRTLRSGVLHRIGQILSFPLGLFSLVCGLTLLWYFLQQQELITFPNNVNDIMYQHLMWFSKLYSSSKGFTFSVNVVMIVGLIGLPILARLIRSLFDRIGGFYGFSVSLSKCMHEISAAKAALASAQLEKERKKSMLDNLNDAHFSYLADLRTKRSDELAKNQVVIEQLRAANKESKEALSCVLTLYRAAKQTVQSNFYSFLDERDWENVDLLIFNFETGRALDMRDALLQVDNERRNQQLHSAILNASKTVANIIVRGFGELQSTIENQFLLMDEQISKLSKNLKSGFTSLSREVSQMRDTVEDSADALLNALASRMDLMISVSRANQENFNKRSDELVGGMQKMISLEDKLVDKL